MAGSGRQPQPQHQQQQQQHHLHHRAVLITLLLAVSWAQGQAQLAEETGVAKDLPNGRCIAPPTRSNLHFCFLSPPRNCDQPT